MQSLEDCVNKTVKIAQWLNKKIFKTKASRFKTRKRKTNGCFPVVKPFSVSLQA